MRYAVLVVLGAALGLGAWWLLGGEERPAGPRSVLVVTIDTTRTDAIGRGRETPAVVAFLDRATQFTAARTTVPLTLPAHVTLFSGLLPNRHGIHENLVPPLPRERRGYPLVAEEFRAAGYRTAAFVSSPVLGAKTGLDAGFEHYTHPEFAGGRWSGEQSDVPAPEQLAAALTWLREREDGERFFCWVHFFDPHAPYLPYAGDGRRRGTRAGDPLRELYAGEVRRVDAALARLLRAVPDDTIVVLATDHGEGLGDHGEPGHGVLCHETTAGVFLAVRAAELDADAEDADPRSLADVAPTLRAWCDLPRRPGDGRLLTEPTAGRVVVTESLLTYRTYGWGQVFAATDGRFTLLESGPTVALYDRAADPREEKPLDPVGHEAYERLDRALQAYRSGAAAPEPGGAYFDAGSPYGHAVRPLANYLSRRENAQLRDPAGGFAFRRRMKTARGLIHQGLQQRNAGILRRAVAILERLAREEPDNPAPQLYLAHARGRLGAVTGERSFHRQAAVAAHAAIERGYRVAPLLHDLLYESLQGGHADDLRAALVVARDGRITPDIHCARRVAEAGRALSGEGRALARDVLRRWEALLRTDDDRSAVRALADELSLSR